MPTARFWLAPEQVRILPVSDQVLDYALTFKSQLSQHGVRVTVDAANERLPKKICIRFNP
ncbi:MAG: hypothetical protein HC921_22310 [Synechococcaceae cyanobacterium SM2_3_1]|nr:hypothetical protein [Synechococcaceae cyanobacterium SM2_3_1]